MREFLTTFDQFVHLGLVVRTVQNKQSSPANTIILTGPGNHIDKSSRRSGLQLMLGAAVAITTMFIATFYQPLTFQLTETYTEMTNRMMLCMTI